MIPIVPSSSQNPKWNLRPATSCRLITESASFQLHLGAQGVQRQQLGSCIMLTSYKKLGVAAPLQSQPQANELGHWQRIVHFS